MINLMEPHIYKHPAQHPRDMDRYATMKVCLTLTVLLLIAFAGVNGRVDDEGDIYYQIGEICYRTGHDCRYDYECCGGDCAWYGACR
uniref:UPF0506 domain-containing protein n=1 Tax=Mesocestoides corti TaxID=53468 RepID=A0A5K3FI66_MESCO